LRHYSNALLTSSRFLRGRLAEEAEARVVVVAAAVIQAAAAVVVVAVEAVVVVETMIRYRQGQVPVLLL
jgi:hypothetical protein